MQTLYKTTATAIAGREGHAETEDGALSVKLAKPGASSKGTNPEQLFACAYAACFGGAVTAVAKKHGLTDPGEVKVQAKVKLNQDENGGFFISVVLDTNIQNADSLQAEQIVKEAHEMCPYSKATRNNIDVELKASGTTVELAA